MSCPNLLINFISLILSPKFLPNRYLSALLLVNCSAICFETLGRMHALRAIVCEWWISANSWAPSHRFSNIFLDSIVLIDIRSVMTGARAERTEPVKFWVNVKYLSFFRILAFRVLNSWLSIGGSREQEPTLGYFLINYLFFSPCCNQGFQQLTKLEWISSSFWLGGSSPIIFKVSSFNSKISSLFSSDGVSWLLGDMVSISPAWLRWFESGLLLAGVFFIWASDVSRPSWLFASMSYR